MLGKLSFRYIYKGVLLHYTMKFELTQKSDGLSIVEGYNSAIFSKENSGLARGLYDELNDILEKWMKLQK